jgi:DNA-directed RNA polymerase specialized sigma24 family protein
LGGAGRRLRLEEFHRIEESPDDLLDHLDEALTRLVAEEPDRARLVPLRFFAGLSTPEAAEAPGISTATAERWWSYARAWLYDQLEDREENPPVP